MRGSVAVVGLLLFAGACGTLTRKAHRPDGRRSPLGVLVKATRGPCTGVLVGSGTHRVCAPAAESDSAATATDGTAAPADSTGSR